MYTVRDIYIYISDIIGAIMMKDIDLANVILNNNYSTFHLRLPLILSVPA